MIEALATLLALSVTALLGAIAAWRRAAREAREAQRGEAEQSELLRHQERLSAAAKEARREADEELARIRLQAGQGDRSHFER